MSHWGHHDSRQNAILLISDRRVQKLHLLLSHLCLLLVLKSAVQAHPVVQISIHRLVAIRSTTESVRWFVHHIAMTGFERLPVVQRLIRLVASDGLGEVDRELRHCKLLHVFQDILLLLGFHYDDLWLGRFRLLSRQWRCAIR